MAVYFKFKSTGEQTFDSVSLEGKSPFISVSELKSQIAGRKKIDKSNGLLLTNVQTNEEYKDDSHLIPKNTRFSSSVFSFSIFSSSKIKHPRDFKRFFTLFFFFSLTSNSVIVQVVPLMGGSSRVALSSKAAPHQILQQRALQNQRIVTEGADLNIIKGDKKSYNDDFGPELFSSDNNTRNENQEDHRINALISHSASNLPTTGPKAPRQNHRRGDPSQQKAPPPTYICHRCNQPGHFIYDCPTNGDPTFNHSRPTTQHGVPMKFLKTGQDGQKEYKPNE